MMNSGADIMGTLRFTLLAVGLFALTFVGVSWANKGFPILTYRVVPLRPDARIPTFDESVQRGLRQDWEDSKTLQSGGSPEHEKLRMDILAASTAYELSPCDDHNKKALVAAITNYVGIWLNIFHCRSGGDVCPASKNARFELASAAFHTPGDRYALAEMRKATEQGGITPEDFPPSIREEIAGWISRPLGGESREACIIARESGKGR